MMARKILLRRIILDRHLWSFISVMIRYIDDLEDRNL